MALRHVVLMGDPQHFSILGGANPHTRDWLGRRRTVDRTLARRQWRGLRELLGELGVHVHVLRADPERPGLVYPANAGFRHGDDFVLSNLTPTRAAEQSAYRAAVEALGLHPRTIRARFEGEADLFSAADVYLFTHGPIKRQRFVPAFRMPPWKRVYGFRSEPAALDEIEAPCPLDREVLRVELRDERYYHGDTCLCSFGPGRRALLAFLPALAPHSAEMLGARFGKDLVELQESDARIYAANSFHIERPSESLLVMPFGISGLLRREVESRGARVLEVDVSEFHKKGGGSVKCMIGDLGPVVGHDDPGRARL